MPTGMPGALLDRAARRRAWWGNETLPHRRNSPRPGGTAELRPAYGTLHVFPRSGDSGSRGSREGHGTPLEVQGMLSVGADQTGPRWVVAAPRICDQVP